MDANKCHIESIVIHGFKSYRDQTIVKPFSPGHNVVVGRNGSGKSNFFSAIRFVLSDAYTSLSREERQALLHDGTSSSATLSAFVEIVFANPDGRFPTGKPQVVLRRTIGLKKDEYSLDRKTVSKGDVVNLLESAGFSRSNPYYIVPQGRISSLTNAKDSERLQLLKEVAGTRVYESKRTESLKIMQETNAKREKIVETLTSLEARLSELDHEKEELREFQEKDRERRCIEYSLYQQELDSVLAALDKLKKDYESDLVEASKRTNDVQERDMKLQSLESTINGIEQSQSQSLIDKQQATDELAELYKTRTQLELAIEDARDAGEGSTSRRDALTAELRELEQNIRTFESELEELTANWEEKVQKESELKRALDDTTVRLTALYAKQARASQFSSKEERDEYLKAEVKSLEGTIATRQQEVNNYTTEQEAIYERIADYEKRIESINSQKDQRDEEVDSAKNELVNSKRQRVELLDNRKELWREESKIEQTLAWEKEQKTKAEYIFHRTMDKDTANGLKAVDTITRRLNLNGVYGPLFTLFEVPDEFKAAAEITANTSLFHVVVDNDATAQQILNVMVKERLGRITFMPLNRLKPSHFDYPEADDAIPLIEQLTFNQDLLPAFKQVFGRTIVCPDLHVAGRYARSYGLNATTIDGDVAERRGTLSGGFHDRSRSRLDAVRQLMEWVNRVSSSESKSIDIKERLTTLDQEINQLASSYTRAESKLMSIRSRDEPLVLELESHEQDKVKLQHQIRQLKREKDENDSDIEDMRTQISVYKEELQEEMSERLTEEEEERLKVQSHEQVELKEKLAAQTAETTDVESRKELLEVEINENLRRNRTLIESRLRKMEDGATDNSDQDESSRQAELDSTTRRISKLQKQLARIEDDLNNYDNEIKNTKNRIDEIQSEQDSQNRSIGKQAKSVERYHAKTKTLQSRRMEFQRNIRDLGVLPEEAFSRYTNTSSERLLKQLSKVRKALSGYSHVNKKAVEQFTTFTEQRDELIQRRDEQDQGADSIQELILHLDQRKDEAIERTFKQVSKYFSEVFEKLVPAGHGKLVMQKRIQGGDDESSDEDEERSTTDNYTGVSIKVSFTSKTDEGVRIAQLSGGQKAVVALATVFAIQRTDPAPFYLFDEIDAALDAQYRSSVASIISELSQSAQFITTTFRPEQISVADSFYGVMFTNQKISTITPIRREDAQEFVTTETTGTG
ncbi:hypothetical protein E3Q22_02348 [Wallemia mellicola]|uniref:Structural maintenance of chromosomes protein n=1 Tax=Wallemia mellicola TaxID=1708541 RepID=A0A4T0TKK8_9BASI|nr:hypothetical protein E3Q22_02348 [Wallemia mellicola]TIB98276.1 hypothetical protein E3Q18_02116 [Wallemia mellicola]TIC00816.1 hypothetical protein E3Q17_02017 [Wallemia mellicola]TIC11552.1 hypothetical protein E3Q14_02226 [Wallemia mellicola]TIC22541.1 hypothetical protein E3Q12_02602 [Wallemia mellicola]